MQSERYWIERSFQDAIDLAGMADYWSRNWDAWHHHMTLVFNGNVVGDKRTEAFFRHKEEDNPPGCCENNPDPDSIKK